MGLKVRFKTVFPAYVLVQSPILLDKSGFTYTFSIDSNALQTQLSSLFQPIDDTLVALAALNSTAGLLTQTGVNTFTKRTLTGTANEITVTNGDGASGTPTLSLPSALTFTGKTVTGGTFSSPTLTTPSLGVATATSINALNIANTGGGNLSIANGTTITGNVSVTFSGTASSLTLQGTGTVVNRDTVDTLTNKTFDTAGTGNVFKINGTQISANTGTGSNVLGTGPTITTPTISGATITTSSINGVTLGGVGQYPGEPSNGTATAGNIGEEIVSNILSASAVSLVSGTPANVATITLTAGDWDIEAQPCFGGGATTQVGGLRASISTTTATENAASPNFCGGSYGSITAFSTFDVGLSIGRIRVSLTGSQQYWLVVNATFSVSTCKAYGKIRARRVR
jgi:hypothetical protein